MVMLEEGRLLVLFAGVKLKKTGLPNIKKYDNCMISAWLMCRGVELKVDVFAKSRIRHVSGLTF
jgi:hypothetical protein